MEMKGEKKLLEEIDKLIQSNDKRIWKEMIQFIRSRDEEKKVYCPFCESELRKDRELGFELHLWCKKCNRYFFPSHLLGNPKYHNIIFKDYIKSQLNPPDFKIP